MYNSATVPNDKEPTKLRALRVPESLDAEIESEMKRSGDSRTAVMIRWLRGGVGTARPAEVDWPEFDRQVHIAQRHTPSIARALRAAREATGHE